MPRIRKGKNLPRRDRPFQSRQNQVSRAAVDNQIFPASVSLTLATFAPSVATPRLVTPAVATLTLSEFAPTVATPRLLTPAKASLALATFAPTIRTPALLRPATLALTLASFAPTVTITANVQIAPGAVSLVLTGFAPTITGAVSIVVIPPEIPTPQTGGFGHVISDTGRRLRFPFASELQPVLVKPPTANLRLATFAPIVAIAEAPVDIQEAYIALYASGALSDEEYVALIAA